MIGLCLLERVMLRISFGMLLRKHGALRIVSVMCARKRKHSVLRIVTRVLPRMHNCLVFVAGISATLA